MDKKQSENKSTGNWRNQSGNTSTDNKPDPKRFENFTLTRDESGFTIPGSNHIFYFDAYGGWYDEFENYYNANGQPCTPPEYSGEEDDYYDDDEDPADDLAKEYDMDGDDDEDYEDHTNTNYDAIYTAAENGRRLGLYVGDQDIDFEIKNINWKCTEEQFGNEFLSKHGLGDNYEFDINERGRFSGTCLVTVEKKLASKLLSLDGYKFWGRNLKVYVLPPPEIEEDDLDNNPPVDSVINTKLTEETKTEEPSISKGTGSNTAQQEVQKSPTKTQGQSQGSKQEEKKVSEPKNTQTSQAQSKSEKPKESAPVDISADSWSVPIKKSSSKANK